VVQSFSKNRIFERVSQERGEETTPTTILREKTIRNIPSYLWGWKGLEGEPLPWKRPSKPSFAACRQFVYGNLKLIEIW